MDVAEDEIREAVTDAYEAEAGLDDEPEDSMDDIERVDDGSDPRVPELVAIHENLSPDFITGAGSSDAEDFEETASEEE
jgi:hypothetical protein